MKTTLLLTLTLFSFTLFASELRYYDVEIIIFENLDLKARESEKWHTSVEIDYPENTIQIGHPWPGLFPKEYNPKLSFKRLSRRSFRLKEQAKKISESDSRRILLHTGWRQPGMAKDVALTVKLNKKIPTQSSAKMTEFNEVQQEYTPAPSPWATKEAGVLEGKVKVILARYLHVDVDMIFQAEALQASDIYTIDDSINEEIKPVVYRLKQSRRRMRSRELHYIDNPVLGMLVLITPYESKR
jgi:hypothetical protein